MKSVQEIYRDMLSVFAKETGMTLYEGSEMAVRLYAFAVQLHGLYVQNEWTQAQCFPQTAVGEYLDRHASLRSLVRRGATRAMGSLRFRLERVQSTEVTIPSGSVCMSAGLVRFETTQLGRIAAGALFVDVPARAVEMGSSGNVPADAVRVMALAPLGVSSCTNPSAFAGGAEEEGDEGLRERVLESFRRMPNGTNAAYYEREALAFEGVVAVNVIGRARGRGTVDVVIAVAAGSPDASLVAAVQAHLQQQRELAVDVLVRAPGLTAFTITVKLAVRPGMDFNRVAAEVKSLLSAQFDGRGLGKSILLGQLGKQILSVEGVENYRILSPTQDIVIAPGVLPRVAVTTPQVLT